MVICNNWITIKVHNLIANFSFQFNTIVMIPCYSWMRGNIFLSSYKITDLSLVFKQSNPANEYDCCFMIIVSRFIRLFIHSLRKLNFVVKYQVPPFRLISRSHISSHTSDWILKRELLKWSVQLVFARGCRTADILFITGIFHDFTHLGGI